MRKGHLWVYNSLIAGIQKSRKGQRTLKNKALREQVEFLEHILKTHTAP